MSNIDWQCMDCGVVYRAPENGPARPLPGGGYAGTGFELPQFCPECGDHSGWEKMSN